MALKIGDRVRFNWEFGHEYLRGEGTIVETEGSFSLYQVEPDPNTIEESRSTEEDFGDILPLFFEEELEAI